MLRQESGQALPIVLLVLALGAAVIMPAMVYANAALIAQRNAKQALVDQYSAESCNTYVMWKLLYDTSFMNSITGTTTVTCTINGVDVPVTISPVATSSYIDATTTGTLTNVTLPANNEIWAVMNIPATALKDAAIAYDTVSMPSQVSIPFTTGSVTYYFHNNPTPPVENTGIPAAENSNPWSNLTMTTTAPTAITLYNYDQTTPLGAARDAVAGRWLEKKAEAAACSTKILDGYRYRIVWRSPVISASPVTIDGTVTIRWWWTTEDGSLLGSGQTENITMWLCQYDPTQAVSTPLKNPDSLFSGAGKLTPTLSMWVKPFDLRAVVGLTKLQSRVDRVSDTAIAVRSWQLGGS